MGVFIPILALMIPIVAILSRSDIGHAIADAIRHNSGAGAGGSGELEQLRGEVDQLRAEMETMQSQLMEAHERLDFAERLLAKPREAEVEGK